MFMNSNPHMTMFLAFCKSTVGIICFHLFIAKHAVVPPSALRSAIVPTK